MARVTNAINDIIPDRGILAVASPSSRSVKRDGEGEGAVESQAHGHSPMAWSPALTATPTWEGPKAAARMFAHYVEILGDP